MVSGAIAVSEGCVAMGVSGNETMLWVLYAVFVLGCMVM